MTEPTDSRANEAAFRMLYAMSKARLVDEAMGLTRSLAVARRRIEAMRYHIGGARLALEQDDPEAAKVCIANALAGDAIQADNDGHN